MTLTRVHRRDGHHPPEKLGLPFTHWSIRKLAGYLAAGTATPTRTWSPARRVRIGRERLRQILHARDITFQRTRTWKESTTPPRTPSWTGSRR